MEILALLLLGFIAMLAIVPPIIRGKLDESPLATTQSFQRSMQEMANSIENGGGRERGGPGDRSVYGRTEARAGSGSGLREAARISSSRRAAVRRNRVMAFLTVFAATWGAAALVSGKAWCLIVFAAACVVLTLFWGLSLIMPLLLSRPRAAERREAMQRSRGNQAFSGR